MYVVCCAAGCFPFTYLGLPIGANMNLTFSWQILIDRFQKRLSSWKANLLSIGGRLTLIKADLGSLGIYYLSIFKALETILNSMESLRSRFFWGGSQDSRNMAWVKWSQVLSSFKKGGLQIGSLKAFNLALLQKWRWRLLSSPNNMWVNIIKALHGQEGGLNNQDCSFNGTWSRIIGTSNFLHSKGIIPLNSFCFKVGCDTRVRFWKDIWIGDSSLHTRYNRLYRLDKDKDWLIIDRIVNGQWQWNWSRSDIGTRNTAYLNDLLLEISQIDISVDEDTCTWVLSNDDTFSVKSARRLIDSKLLPSIPTPTVWDKFLPRKVNIFLWRLSLDRLPHRLNLSSRGLDIPTISCSSCNGNVESADHVFFECDLVKESWCLVRKWCDISIPMFASYDTWNSWFFTWQATKAKSRRLYIIFAALFWWIWRYRNSVTFTSDSIKKGDLFDNIRTSSFS
nr:RNA-directed DNA polymerase, eukaryota, reverse transcriptase zinc-binding domain protein [Tanacetum cinerariifolium]